jgi:hypothetical protein
MTFTEIFSSEELSNSEKVAELASITTKARKDYGNTEQDIGEPTVNTSEGLKNIKYLNDEDKVAIAKTEFKIILNTAVASVDCQEGTVLDSEVKRLVAINPVLVNILCRVESAYI